MDGVRFYYYVVANETITEVCLGNCSLVLPQPPPLPPPIHYESPSPPPPFSHRNVLSDSLIAMVALLSAAFLLISFYVTIIRCCQRRNSSGRALQRQNPPTLDEFLEGQDPINHFWYINTVGLEESIVNSITVCKFKRDEDLIEGTDCSVCLSEFQEGEDLRLLPKCSHAFHLECIDRWLRAHVNCPLCRAPIMADYGNPPPAENGFGGASLVDRTHFQGSSDGGGNDDEQNGNSGFVTIELGDVEEPKRFGDLDAVGVIVGQSSSNRLNGTIVEESLPEVQPIRRSASLNSLARIRVSTGLGATSAREFSSIACGSTMATGSFDCEKPNLGEFSRFKGVPIENGGNSCEEKVLGNVEKGPCMQKRPMDNKRSFSISGNFFSKHGRNRSSVLPL